jgi:gliding motility-associated-like protein
MLLGLSSISNAQLFSPGRDWADTTQYSKIGVIQDSIYVFFSPSASIKAKFSDGSVSSFSWYKYNSLISNIANRFELIATASETDVTESNLINLDVGGYKVTITRKSDLAIETYYCWVMIDVVVVTSIDIYNGCDFLELATKTLPSLLSLRTGNVFRYWDIKSSTSSHREINKYGDEYFKNLTWHASDAQIPVPSDPSLILTIDDPAPLYDSKYDILIHNPFGRDLASETALLPAKATKADFTLYIDKENDGTWTDGGSTPNGEAPLALKFDTQSINADSLYWQILNDNDLFEKGGDSIIWRGGYLFSDGIGVIPNVKLVPGSFPVQHIAVKESSGCRDTMTIYVDVDTSAIKTNAIPNVFSPNGDGANDFFKLKDVDINVSSIKSFHVSILSRRGQRVYEYSGNPKEWAGWNGKIDGTKGDAPEGVYYFIIEAVGWDNRNYKGGAYKGFVYLLRGR